MSTHIKCSRCKKILELNFFNNKKNGSTLKTCNECISKNKKYRKNKEIQKNWSYFQCTYNKDGRVYKIYYDRINKKICYIDNNKNINIVNIYGNDISHITCDDDINDDINNDNDINKEYNRNKNINDIKNIEKKRISTIVTYEEINLLIKNIKMWINNEIFVCSENAQSRDDIFKYIEQYQDDNL